MVIELPKRRFLDFLTQYLAKYKAMAPHLGMNVLDIGCGSGTIIPFLPPNASYVGIDADAELIERLKPIYPDYSFFQLDLENDDMLGILKGRFFSSIVLSAVIEHLHNPGFVLRESRSLMAENTSLIVTTPTGIGDAFSRVVEASFFGSKKGNDIRPHVCHFSKRQLISMGASCGLVCLHYQKLGWHRQNQLAIFRNASI